MGLLHQVIKRLGWDNGEPDEGIRRYSSGLFVELKAALMLEIIKLLK
mgnify:CR=1 FL=1